MIKMASIIRSAVHPAVYAVAALEKSPMRPSLAPVSTLVLLASLLTGCAGFNSTTAVPSQIAVGGLHGVLNGGQQPVSGSTIQLFQVGATGYGAGATPLLTTPLTTDAGGNFSLPDNINCTAGTQLYITATGGNPGVTGPANNTALALMNGVGLCDSLPSIPFITINEITTVAAVWALSPFMTGSSTSVTVGAPASNQSGLATAFSDIAQIANNATGATPGAALPSGGVAPTTEINTLADILAGCVNSGTNTGGTCPTLFVNATPPGGSAPTNTIAAALNIARNPGRNVTTLLSLAGPTAPFQPTLPLANDFTLGVTYPVGSAPAGIAVDAANNIWVANSASSSVTKLTHAGVPTTYSLTTGGLSLPTAIAIDAGGNAWVVNTSNSLTQISTTGTGTNFTGGGLNAPTAIAIDGLGMIWVANGGATTLSAFDSTGNVVSGSPFASGAGNGAGQLAVGINPR